VFAFSATFEIYHGESPNPLMSGAFGLGQIFGPAFAGIVSDRLGSFTVPSIIAAVALLFAAALTRN
jgi:MFS family permease